MVVYDLICNKKHRFEGWFPNFEEYQKQAAKGQICCPTCATTKVEKLPHACAVHTNKEAKKEQPQTERAPSPQVTEGEMKEILLRLHHYVRENFEDVGPRFADEARQIHYDKAKARPIHGTSTSEEREQLDEEGIPYTILPKPQLDS
jgi:hypothetical protein